VWEPLDRDRVRALSGRRDYEVGEVGEKGFGATFPHAIDATPNPAAAVLATPLGNELVLATALAAIDGEHLGTDEVADLLVVSLSSHDYIAHGWGHESWETWDGELRLDDSLARFLAGLDAKVGTGRWAMLVTSDHGGSHLPELVHGGRIRYAQIAERANEAAITVLGKGAWIAAAEYPTVVLTERARDHDPAMLDRALDAILAAIRDMPGIERVERTATLGGHCEQRPAADRPACLAIDVERSGELIYTPAPGWVLEDDTEAMATSHGTAHDYDQLVPVIELAPDRVGHTPATAPDHEMPETAVAGIVAHWLGVPAPTELPPPPLESGWAP
jgi:hypothetical protein